MQPVNEVVGGLRFLGRAFIKSVTALSCHRFSPIQFYVLDIFHDLAGLDIFNIVLSQDEVSYDALPLPSKS